MLPIAPGMENRTEGNLHTLSVGKYQILVKQSLIRAFEQVLQSKGKETLS